MTIENHISGNDECVVELLKIFGLEDHVVDFNLTVSVNKEMIVNGTHWVKQNEFDQVVEFLHKYKIEKIGG